MKKIAKYIGWCLLTFIPLGVVYGQITANPFSLQSVSQTVTEGISQTFQGNGLHTVVLISQENPVYGVAVSGHVAFHDANNSMVRVTAVCSDGIEYLVYETSPLFADGQEFNIEDVAMETAVLDAENIVRLNVMLVNATFILTDVKYNKESIQNVPQRKSTVAVTQEDARISRLNENLEKQGHLWRAGKTSLSSMTFEQKKAIFGDTIPYLGGYEYYKGGIFVRPDYVPQKASNEDALFVKEWDWRNRHGKNWMTSIKDQGACNSCAIFALLGTIEAYANLYYNRKIDLDLAEQELLCASVIPICTVRSSLNEVYDLLTKNGGVMEESCFAYVGTKPPCNQCDNPTENLNVDNVNILGTIIQTELKRKLFKAPLAISSDKARHGVVLAGYKRLEEGDVVRYPNTREDKRWDYEYIDFDSPLIGSTAWLIKNSWGANWGDNGYCLMVEDICNVEKDKAEIIGKVHSLRYTDKDIIVEDADEDGYYFWGVGERPASLPDWIPMEPDGDDTDPTKGPLDNFGNLRNINFTDTLHKIHITSSQTLSSSEYCLPTMYVEAGATLTITGNICLTRHSRIFVKNGGILVLDGAHLTRASVKVYSGGKVEIKNGSSLERYSDDSLEVDLGGTMLWLNGTIKAQ